MKIGKVSESVLKRSVLKQIKTKRNEIVNGAGVGGDCAILTFEEGETVAVSTQPLILENGKTVRYGMIKAANNLAAGGAQPVGMTMSVLVPETVEEPEIKQLLAETEQVCGELQVQLIGGHTEVSSAVRVPVVTFTAIGKSLRNRDNRQVIELKQAERKKQNAGLDIVVTKWIALEGTALVSEEKEQDLLTKYPTHLVQEAKRFAQYLSVLPEAEIGAKFGVSKMHDASEGGIFGGLWELAESLGVGMEVDLKKIPVKQETIEVCEFLEINPYEFLSAGSLLIATEKGTDLVRRLEAEGIPAVVVGKTTDNNDRVVINEEERRFLEPRKTDEIYKVKF